jgi:hypothetical protein
MCTLNFKWEVVGYIIWNILYIFNQQMEVVIAEILADDIPRKCVNLNHFWQLLFHVPFFVATDSSDAILASYYMQDLFT